MNCLGLICPVLQTLLHATLLPYTAHSTLQVAGHMREAVRCMEAAQEARTAGLTREQQLAAEVRSLRQQLAGRLPEGDPARALQVGPAGRAFGWDCAPHSAVRAWCIVGVMSILGRALAGRDSSPAQHMHHADLSSSARLLQAEVSELEAANASLQQERTALLGQVQQLSAVGQELSSSCKQLEAGLQAATKEHNNAQAGLEQAQVVLAADRQRWERDRQQLASSLAAAQERLAAAEEGHKAARGQAERLQARLDSLREESQAAAQQAAAREQELQAELRLLAAKAEAEHTAAAERGEAAAAAGAAEAGRQAAELAAVRKEAGGLEAEKARLQVGGLQSLAGPAGTQGWLVQTCCGLSG